MRTKRLLSLFDAFSLLSVLFLLAVVAFNIIARQIFDLSNGTINLMIPGAIELSRYTLLLLVFAALPRAACGKLVRVDLLEQHLPASWRKILDSLWLLFMAAFCAILFWQFKQKAFLVEHRGDATQDLQMPLYYFYALISLACFVTTLSCLLKAFFRKEKYS